MSRRNQKARGSVFPRLAIVAGLALMVSGLSIVGWFSRSNSTSSSNLPSDFQSQVGGLPLIFEANLVQVDSKVRFLSRGRGYSLLLTNTEALLTLPTAKPHIQPACIRMTQVGANPEPQVKGSGLTAAKSHYYLGNDPRGWNTNVPHYAKLAYDGVYPCIDLIFYGNRGELEYDYVLAAGANPRVITLGLEGAATLSIEENGDLRIAAESGDLRLKKPRAYQWSQGSVLPVESAYRMKGAREIGFELGAFDASLPLVIDPVLSYSTYLGGSEDDRGLGIGLDAEGNTYVAGVTQSANFPHSIGSSAGGEDVFVSKLNPSGSLLIYSIYLGGSSADVAKALAVDATGNAYVLGGTRSTNFPVTPGALQTGLRGAGDVFVLKLNPAGDQLIYSTYLGGTRGEGFEGGGLAIDAAGQAYITGVTDSLDFPTSRVTFQRSFGGGSSDAFVSKLSADGTRLVYSTYLGGFDLDEGQGIAVDSGGRAYVTGRTRSPNLVMINSFQLLRRSSLDDAFLTKFNALGDLVTYSTFFGGTGNESAHGIAVDDSGLASIAGETDSTDFLTTSDALKKEH